MDAADVAGITLNYNGGEKLLFSRRHSAVERQIVTD
jgi:hypothetical protein